jgi:hypothetical protein
MSRAFWRASSCLDREIFRVVWLGVHLGFSMQATQSCFRAKYFLNPSFPNSGRPFEMFRQ